MSSRWAQRGIRFGGYVPTARCETSYLWPGSVVHRWATLPALARLVCVEHGEEIMVCLG